MVGFISPFTTATVAVSMLEENRLAYQTKPTATHFRDVTFCLVTLTREGNLSFDSLDENVGISQHTFPHGATCVRAH